MSVATIGLRCPSVFEADLPTIAYEESISPDEAHRAIRQARAQGPIAMGPHGPEMLNYDLARTPLRDPRFCPPPGLGLEAQGITSGPLWDRVITSLLSINVPSTPGFAGSCRRHSPRGRSRGWTPRSSTSSPR